LTLDSTNPTASKTDQRVVNKDIRNSKVATVSPIEPWEPT